jgi:hypothetical protein
MSCFWKLGLVAGCLILPGWASTAYTAPGDLNTDAEGEVNVGIVFTANSIISVDALGFYATAGVSSNTLAIYDSVGDLLASTAVTTSDPLIANYYYATITPLVLNAGTQYTVVDFASDDNGNFSYGGPPTTDPQINYLYSDFVYGSSLAFPTTPNPSGFAYYGPNFTFSVVTPEPGSLLLLGTGLVALAYAAKRRARYGSAKKSRLSS